MKDAEEQSNLGVYIHNSLKVAEQVDMVIKKAYRMPPFISHCVE